MKISFIIILIVIIQSYSLLTNRLISKSISKFLEPKQPKQATVCNYVTLERQYSYSGVVRSGYLKVSKGYSVLAFLFYGKSDVVDPKLLFQYPTIIWLNGGPGSSSQFGNFQQIGPLLLKNSFVSNVQKNKFTLANHYNLLFIDQPVGTGLSYADPTYINAFAKNMDDVAKDFYIALQQLYNTPQGCFNEANLNIPHTTPLFIFGEGYAGKYVPAIASKIVQMRKQNSFLAGFKGIAIGNGFTSPYNILAEVGNFAFELGLLDYQQRAQVEKILLNATHQNNFGLMDQLHYSFDNALEYIIERTGYINVYDITKDGQYDQLLQPYFLSQANINLYALNPEIIYDSQSDNVYDNLYSDFMKDQKHLVEFLLNQSIPLLIYNGQDDLTVQNSGTMRWVETLNYRDANQFRDKLLGVWKTNDKITGSIKKAGVLEFRIVNKAGHMVPMGRPQQSLTMFRDWITRNNI